MQPRDLSEHTAYVAGRGVEEVARETDVEPDELVTLSSNENPLGPSPAAVEAVRAHAGEVHAYPKAAHGDLRAAVAERWDVADEQVWLGPGADGALDYLARATLAPGDRVLVPDPGFAYYPMSARFHHGTVATYGLAKAEGFPYTAEGVLSAYDGERVVYITTPHNPSGAEMPLDEIERVAAATDPETLVVVDEAYGEFTDGPSAAGLLEARDDVAVVRTFSKAYGLAGLRLGYALVPDAWADAYAKVNTPFAVSELACRAGLAALDDGDHVAETVAVCRRAREQLRETAVPPTFESGGNFVLVDVSTVAEADLDGEDAAAADGAETPAGMVAAAMQHRGVVVRDCTSFGLPGCVRITAGTEDDTGRAVRALNEVVR